MNADAASNLTTEEPVPENLLDYLFHKWQVVAESEERAAMLDDDVEAFIAFSKQVLKDNPLASYDVSSGRVRLQNGDYLNLSEPTDETGGISGGIGVEKPQPQHLVRGRMERGFSRGITDG